MTLNSAMYDENKIVSREGQAFELFKPFRSLIRSHTENVYDFLPKNLAPSLQRRYYQFLANTSFVSFRRALYARPDDVIKIIDCNRRLELDAAIGFCFAQGKITERITSFSVRQYLLFWIRWAITLLTLIKFLGSKPIKKGMQISVLYGCISGLVRTQSDLERIDAFLRKNPVSGLNTSKAFIFHGSTKLPVTTPDTYITRLPEAIAISLLDLSINERVNLLFQHFSGLFKSHKLFVNLPGVISFAEEFGDFFVLSKIAEMGWIGAVVHTTSNSALQRLWTHDKLVTTHHIYYNIYALHPVHKSDPNPDLGMLDYPIFTAAQGTHWMWSDEDREAMQSMYKLTDVKTLGLPLLFYSKIDATKSLSINPEFDIVIFDVTPVNATLVKQANVTFYYGDVGTACKIIGDVIDIATSFQNELDVKLKIALKPKRSLDDTHIHPKYVDFLNQTISRYDNFSILSRDVKIQTLTHPKTVFISRPYTSIAKLVALHGSKSLFYDPTQELINIPLFMTDVEFSSGVDDLKSKLTNAFLDVRGQS